MNEKSPPSNIFHIGREAVGAGATKFTAARLAEEVAATYGPRDEEAFALVARNEAGGLAYALAPKHVLAQLAATGCFNGTFYAQSDEQLQTLSGALADDGKVDVDKVRDALRPFVKGEDHKTEVLLDARDITPVRGLINHLPGGGLNPAGRRASKR